MLKKIHTLKNKLSVDIFSSSSQNQRMAQAVSFAMKRSQGEETEQAETPLTVLMINPNTPELSLEHYEK